MTICFILIKQNIFEFYFKQNQKPNINYFLCENPQTHNNDQNLLRNNLHFKSKTKYIGILKGRQNPNQYNSPYFFNANLLTLQHNNISSENSLYDQNILCNNKYFKAKTR